MTGRQIIFRY